MNSNARPTRQSHAIHHGCSGLQLHEIHLRSTELMAEQLHVLFIKLGS